MFPRQATTCSMEITLPMYESPAVMHQRLTFALHHCLDQTVSEAGPTPPGRVQPHSIFFFFRQQLSAGLQTPRGTGRGLSGHKVCSPAKGKEHFLYETSKFWLKISNPAEFGLLPVFGCLAACGTHQGGGVSQHLFQSARAPPRGGGVLKKLPGLDIDTDGDFHGDVDVGEADSGARPAPAAGTCAVQ